MLQSAVANPTSRLGCLHLPLRVSLVCSRPGGWRISRTTAAARSLQYSVGFFLIRVSVRGEACTTIRPCGVCVSLCFFSFFRARKKAPRCLAGDIQVQFLRCTMISALCAPDTGRTGPVVDRPCRRKRTNLQDPRMAAWRCMASSSGSKHEDMR